MTKVSSVDTWLAHKLLAMVGHPPITLVLWNGEEVHAGNETSMYRVVIHDRRTLWQLLIWPELAFGDSYRAGLIDVQGDLVEFLVTVTRAKSTVPVYGLLGPSLSRWLNRPQRNTLLQSRDNIHHHYDIGNDFYRLWLDERMLYTCAYFPTAAATLEEAQLAKMDHVCRKLQLRPGQTVVEAGCGWGALALHMAKSYGVNVKAYNISHQQIIYARERAKAEGVNERVEYIEDDYRNISGKFDAFASVGLLEHVGTDHYAELGQVIHRCLKESGRGLIHTIGRNKAAPNNVWIEKRIFPGSYPPSLREMMAIFEPPGFSILDVENLRLHYAKTLEHWLERFDRSADEVVRMYDEQFVRAWRLYLAGSIAAFTTSSLQLFQVVFAFPTNNDIPWTRAHLYCDQ